MMKKMMKSPYFSIFSMQNTSLFHHLINDQNLALGFKIMDVFACPSFLSWSKSNG